MRKLTANAKIYYNRKLFHKKYLYKIVLRLELARHFRLVLQELPNPKKWKFISSALLQGERKYQDLCDIAKVVDLYNHHLRIEPPWVTVYTNEFDLISHLCIRYSGDVKYVSMPENDGIAELLSSNTVYVQGCPYKYKVILGPTTQNFTNFIEWADKHPKVELSQSSRKQLSKESTKNESWIYVADYDTLTLVKMFLGSVIRETLTVISE